MYANTHEIIGVVSCNIVGLIFWACGFPILPQFWKGCKLAEGVELPGIAPSGRPRLGGLQPDARGSVFQTRRLTCFSTVKSTDGGFTQHTQFNSILSIPYHQS